MEITKTTHPYEFCGRWDWNTGAFKGYHFKTITVVKDGDQVIGMKESDAMNAATAEAAGFPLKDILERVQIDALNALDEKDAALRDAQRKAVELEQQINLAKRT